MRAMPRARRDCARRYAPRAMATSPLAARLRSRPQDSTHYPGTYIAGCYNALRTEIAGHSVQSESLVNAPNWLPLTFAAGDGPWLDLDRVDVLQCQQELDLRRGVLTRRLRIRDSQGRIMRATCRRFVHMGAAHLAALETTIVPENWSGKLRVRSELDGTVQNTGVPRYRQLASRHLVPVEARSLGPAAVLLDGGDQPVAHPRGRGFPDPPVPQWRSRGPRTRP